MDAATLRDCMTYARYPAPLSLARYGQLVGPLQIALQQARCTTVDRVAMFLAQIGAESGSLRWTEELADGSAYNWRSDLGNFHPGDGPRFKGRSFIQITGRYNYGNLSRWAHGHGYVPTASYFVDHPTYLAADRYAFLGPVYYWTVARNMNAYADRRDINGGTYAVNGGYNNLAGRTDRWRRCLALGSALLSSHSLSPTDPNWSDMATQAEVQAACVAAIQSQLYAIGRAVTTHPVGSAIDGKPYPVYAYLRNAEWTYHYGARK